jgi:hypothetical protein
MRKLAWIMKFITAAAFVLMCFRIPAPWGGILGVVLLIFTNKALEAMLRYKK